MDCIFSDDMMASPDSEIRHILESESSTDFDQGLKLERLNIESESALTSEDGNYASCDRWKYAVDMEKEAQIEVNFGFFCLDADVENFKKSGQNGVKKPIYFGNNPLKGSFLKNFKVSKIEKCQVEQKKKTVNIVPNHIQAPYRK